MRSTGRPTLPGITALMALVGGALLLSLGVLAAGELLSAWDAVRWASSSVDTKPLTGAVWYTGDGSAVSRGHGVGLLTVHSLLWGLPLAAVTAYGLRLCLGAMAGDARSA